MKKGIFILLLISCYVQSTFGQTRNNYSDHFLASSFKLFQSADFELANHMLPFIRERFVEELKDTSSFANDFDSLSTYIGIKYSLDGLLKTYSWSERSGGCCHTSATFAQFKTKNSKINYVDLEKPEGQGTEIFITDLQIIDNNGIPFYLIQGWGTCCGGKHYEIARVYQIKNESLIQVESVFDSKNELYVGANRSQKIELKYSPDLKILSYNSYVIDDIGFYTDEKSVVKWKFSNNGFSKIN